MRLINFLSSRSCSPLFLIQRYGKKQRKRPTPSVKRPFTGVSRHFGRVKWRGG